jgi:hypothetical protein
MRSGVLAILLLTAVVVCGCTSNAVPPPWAMAAAKSDAIREHVSQSRARVHVSRKDLGDSIIVGSRVTQFNVDDASTGRLSSRNHGLYNSSSGTALAADSSTPSKDRDIRSVIKEWDRRDKAEDGQIDAALTICHC